MRKKLILVGAIIGIIAIFGILIAAYHSNSPKTPSSTTNTTTNTSPPSFDEDPLLNKGVTSQQLSNMEQVLGQYLSSQNIISPKVGFSSIQRAPTNPNATTPFSELTFVVTLNGKDTYKAKLDSFSLSEIRLYLYDLAGSNLLYDSQNVGGS